MAILKIRDANGNVQEILAIKGERGYPGEQGEKGDPGEKGEKGDTGATGNDYVLTEADKEEIADLVIEKLSVYSGEMEDV